MTNKERLEANNEKIEEITQTLKRKQVSPTDMLQTRIDQTNSCAYLFYYYTGDNLNYLKDLDTSNVTTMINMFNSCSNLASIPQLDTSNVTNMGSMFAGCTKLISIPQLDTSNVTNMNAMFYYSGITVIPKLNTSNNENVINMFKYCSSLTTVSEIDMIKISNATYMFADCTNLTNLTLKNIKTGLSIGSGTSWGTLLTNESLINTIQELWDKTGAISQTLTLSTTSKENIANIYVKLINVTDEMRAEDEYIDNKKPCVVCESTDEGAMTLTEYAISKNWQIAL